MDFCAVRARRDRMLAFDGESWPQGMNTSVKWQTRCQKEAEPSSWSYVLPVRRHLLSSSSPSYLNSMLTTHSYEQLAARRKYEKAWKKKGSNAQDNEQLAALHFQTESRILTSRPRASFGGDTKKRRPSKLEWLHVTSLRESTDHCHGERPPTGPNQSYPRPRVVCHSSLILEGAFVVVQN